MYRARSFRFQPAAVESSSALMASPSLDWADSGTATVSAKPNRTIAFTDILPEVVVTGHLRFRSLTVSRSPRQHRSRVPIAFHGPPPHLPPQLDHPLDVLGGEVPDVDLDLRPGLHQPPLDREILPAEQAHRISGVDDLIHAFDRAQVVDDDLVGDHVHQPAGH